MTYSKIDNLMALVLLLVSFFMLIFVALGAQLHFEGSESLNHYFIAKGVSENPMLLFDHWGKPLFTLLAWPFSYFGSKGVMIFNSLLMLFSAYFAFLFSKKIGAKFAFPVIVFIIFAPVYYRFSQSCLTEPLFGFVALYSAYLFLNKRYYFASILISFIIFSRSEGMLFIPIYAFALLVKKQYKAIPFLAFGLVFYSFIGFVLGKSLLWYYFEYPYNSIVSFYGKGPFLHWFTNQDDITGTPFSIFIAVSFVLIILQSIVQIKKTLEHNNLVLIYLIAVPAFIYIVGHSFLWHKGWSASVGLFRIAGGVIPLLAVVTIVGMNKVLSIFNSMHYKKIIQFSLLIASCVWVISFTFRNRDTIILETPNDISKLIYQSIDWIEQSELEYKNLYVYKTEYYEYFNVNPYSSEPTFLKKNISNRLSPHNELQTGDVIVWDGQTTPNEGGIPVETLDTNRFFKTIITFRPKQEFTVLGGGNYYIKIFKRI